MTPFAAVYSSGTPLNVQEFGTVPDTLGFRKRIGLVGPSTNTTVQPETDALRVPGVTCHTGRVTIKERRTELNKVYKGGVSRKGAVDKRASGHAKYKPYVNDDLYAANKKSDRDNDGIACEQ